MTRCPVSIDLDRVSVDLVRCACLSHSTWSAAEALAAAAVALSHLIWSKAHVVSFDLVQLGHSLTLVPHCPRGDMSDLARFAKLMWELVSLDAPRGPRSEATTALHSQ